MKAAKQAQMQKNRALIHNKPYMALMASQLISNLGDWLHLIALLTLIGMKWQATPFEITGATLCMVIPMLLGGPFAGMLADRFERKRLMVLSDIARAFIVIGLVFVGQMWQVYALLLAKGLFDVLFSPAKNGKLKEIVPSEQLEQAVSYSAIIEQSSKIIGPAMGGVLTAAFGIAACFIIDAASFIISGAILLLVPGKMKMNSSTSYPQAATNATNEPKSSFWSELSAGLRIIITIPAIAYGLLTLAMVLLVLQIADSQLVVLFRDLPNIPESLLGWCIALSGIGTLIAAILLKWLKSLSTLAKMGAGGTLLGFVFAGAGLTVLYGPLDSLIAFIMISGFFLAGLGAGITFIPFQIMLQQRTPVHLTGRVFGTVTSVTSTASVVGPLFGGLLVTAFGPAPAFVLSGSVVMLIGALLLIFTRSIMSRDRETAAPVHTSAHAADPS